ncbi:hypothetical protein ACI6PS_05585 [Flavobacterium sp. PLA-1-15]|uniref:hypothetical protein n=1 Tax=Flavobacterium sp. PLA-1-15 TaxID=3380533 RepID=UPI003B7EB78A
MKKIKLIFTLVAISTFLLCCQDDGGDSNQNLQTGAVPNVTKVENTDSFINLIAINEGENINIGFTIDLAQGDVSSMDVVLFYYKGEEAYKAVLETNVTTFPKEYSLTQTDLIAAFAELNAPEDFEIGDQMIVSTELTLKNGTVIKMLNDDGSTNYGIDVANSPLFSVVQSYNVSCPSDLAGTYQFSTSNIGEPDGGAVAGPVTGTVTLTAKGGGVYDISDGSFGGWEALYGPGDSEGVTLIDICNQIKFGGADNFGDTYTMTNLVVTGNQISFHWENTYGEFGDTTLTRTDGTDWPPLTL